MPEVNVKRPDESRLYNINFRNLLATGETLTGYTSLTADTPSGASALTISGITVSSPNIQFRVAGGTEGYLYEITAVVTTSDGNTLVDCGHLEVAEC